MFVIYFIFMKISLIVFLFYFFGFLAGSPKGNGNFTDTRVSPTLKKFTIDELQKITNNFSKGNLLGRGGLGFVYKGTISDDLRDKFGVDTVAVKELHHESHQGHKQWLAEIFFLGHLQNDNLVQLIGYGHEGKQRLLVYEYLARGSAEKYIYSNAIHPLSWAVRKKIAYGTAKGLAHMHEAEIPVVMRDFKTANILLDEDYNAKVSDFGLARNGPEGRQTHVTPVIMGTLGYAAPEYLETGHLNAKTDVFGFGVMLLELLTGREAINKTRPTAEENLVKWAHPRLKDNIGCIELVDPRLQGDCKNEEVHKLAEISYLCLNMKPKKRPCMREIVEALKPLQEN